jgi:hypothetical protein
VTTFWVAFAAAVAMVFQDFLQTAYTQAVARNRGRLAGIFDSLGWFASIFVTFTSVDALLGHDLVRKIAVVVAVTLANYFGSDYGVQLGERFIKEKI